jgi:hypothetical protein
MSFRFSLGNVYASQLALDTLQCHHLGVASLLQRHIRCDWGNVSLEDKEANNRALEEGGRLLSAYLIGDTGDKIWVVSEADRCSTMVLLPEEY